MAVSSFGSVAVAAVDTTEKWIRLAASGTDYWLNLQTLVGTGNSIAGFYTFKFYADTAATPTGTVKTYDSSFVLGTTTTTLDRDTGSTANYGEIYLSLTSANVWVTVSSTASGYLVVQRLPEKAGVFTSVTVYTTSQTVTINNSSPCALLGAGGGGSSFSSPDYGGGGGGSGYLQKFTVGPGSYALVVGSGGAGYGGYSAGATGGASTFAGYTANGGFGGTPTNARYSYSVGKGGDGGSGGGGANANGGSNGANGANGNHAGGTGSGVTFVPWYTAGAGSSGGQIFTAGGGIYAGAGGALGNYSYYQGGGAGTTPGGGGGCGSGGNAGGAGGNGGLIVFGG